MKTLSTGIDSTLGNYRLLASLFFGEESESVKYLDKKIVDQGEDMEVLADESQMIQMFINLENL